jgi:hypothetical protein
VISLHRFIMYSSIFNLFGGVLLHIFRRLIILY